MEQAVMFTDVIEKKPSRKPKVEIVQRVVAGDIWQLGDKHRLACIDNGDSDGVARLFDGAKHKIAFTSPPYLNQRTYTGVGNSDWLQMMNAAFDQMVANGRADCHILVNLGLVHRNRRVVRYWEDWLDHCEDVGWALFGEYVWDKGTGVPGDWHGRLTPCHEFVYHFHVGSGDSNKWVTPTNTGHGGGVFSKREADGSLSFKSGASAFGQEFKIPSSVIHINMEKSRGIHSEHPAVFPPALPEFMMKTWSSEGDICYDAFAGSGTSFIAGERCGRIVYGAEIAPQYCDLVLARWEQVTGKPVSLIHRTSPA